MEQKGLDEKVRSVAGENGEAERSAIWWRSLLLHSIKWHGTVHYGTAWCSALAIGMVWYGTMV